MEEELQYFLPFMVKRCNSLMLWFTGQSDVKYGSKSAAPVMDLPGQRPKRVRTPSSDALRDQGTTDLSITLC